MRGRVAVMMTGCAAAIAALVYMEAAFAEPTSSIDAGTDASPDAPAADAAAADAPTDAPPVDAGAVDAIVADSAPPTDAAVPEDLSLLRLYVSSLFEFSLGTTNPQPFVRLSLGGSWLRVPAGGEGATEVRAGVTAYLCADLYTGGHKTAAGVGAELEVLLPYRIIGVRLGFETGRAEGNANPSLFTIGGRLYVFRRVFLAADYFQFVGTTDPATTSYSSDNGALMGFGLTGWPGRGE